MGSTPATPSLERLRRIPGLESSPTTELITLDSLAGECELTAGQVLGRRGTVPRHVLLIISGAVAVRTEGGDPQVVGEGHFVGLRPALYGPSHGEDVQVVSDAEVLAIKTSELDRALALPSLERMADRCLAQGPATSGAARAAVAR
jgi:CRP-like cAMP-binding protein